MPKLSRVPRVRQTRIHQMRILENNAEGSKSKKLLLRRFRTIKFLVTFISPFQSILNIVREVKCKTEYDSLEFG